METDWNEDDDDYEVDFLKRTNEAMKNSAAHRVFFSATKEARYQARDNGILPGRNEDGDYWYEVQQGLKAACHGREDISATLQIQLAVLQRLDRNRNILWVVIILLAYVAYRLS